MYFWLKYNYKKKTWKVFCRCQSLGAQTGIPVSQTAWMHHYLWHIDKVKLCLPEAGLFISRTLTLYNQKLTWKCRELKHTEKICSSWSSKGVIKLRHHEWRCNCYWGQNWIIKSWSWFCFLKKEKTGCRYFILGCFGSVFPLFFMLPMFV